MAMQSEPASGVVVAEMNTHHFMFRGAGRTRAAARDALLNAWQVHRSALLARYPERADSIPEASGMEAHFKIYFLEFAMDAGYRDGERIV
ncbi:MAG: hypothetical protein KJ889_09925 [Gammaproteobacteria bacterium]|nr:hypothetical protein [Gammaproteobacteria bacterium]